MRKFTLLLIVLLAGFTLNASAQFGKNTIKIASGDLKPLKGANALKIQYNYDGMTVGDMQEADYIKKHTSDMNKAKAGSGKDFESKWKGNREQKFQPGFEKYFIKGISKAKITASTTKDAKYTLIIKTIKTEPGMDVGVVAVDAWINVYAILVETDKPDVELCRIFANKFLGEAGSFANYDASLRIQASYMNLGKKLSGFMVKTLKKIKK